MLSSVKPFKYLKIVEELEISKVRGGIDYKGYIYLLQKVDTNIECMHSKTYSNRVGFRSINNHEQFMEGNDDVDECDDKNMDNTFGCLIINYNKTKNPVF